jgi:hypothetical protein
MSRRHVTAIGLAAVLSGCLPRLTPLTGVAVPAGRLPRTEAPSGHHKVLFTWEFTDGQMTGRGDGVARVAAPDSARLDFFLAGGFGSGSAVLIGDSLVVPGGVEVVRRLIPPAPLLWATLARVALPNLPDTVIRVEGPVMRADIGRPIAWRLSFRSDTLVRAERVENGRVLEWVERTDGTHIRYRNEGSRRSLDLVITRTDEVPEFDASIWRFGQ